jgi:hypothetical protein
MIFYISKIWHKVSEKYRVYPKDASETRAVNIENVPLAELCLEKKIIYFYFSEEGQVVQNN